MMVRLAEDVRISVVAGDGYVERAGRTPLILQGEGARLRTLALLLGTPRLDGWLRYALADAHPGPSGGDLIRRLLVEEVLAPWDLGPQLADLHQQTAPTREWPIVSPLFETGRMLREYTGESVLALPPPALADVSLAQALASRRTVRQFSGRTISLVDLATLLAMGAGSGAKESAESPLPLVLGGPPAGRTYPSGGALYPVETLVYPLRVEGVDGQFYSYQVLSHRLLTFAPAQPVDALVRLLNGHPVEAASVLVLLFVDFARLSLGKYGEKSYPLALLEAGHLAQNVLLVAAGLGLAGLPLRGFYDQELSLAAGLAFPQEAMVYVLALGAPSR